jgi:NADP-dependent 3-hydroxy acid dehydrogenase YdfG
VEGTDLSGKSAFVIGASSGIGLATANLFSDVGATVHAAARRREAIEDGAGGRNVAAHALDISDKEAVWRAVEEVGEADGIDILVVAAGMNFPERRLEQLTADGWDAMISVNLNGAFYAIRAALPYLRSSGGLVVLISGFEEHVNGVRFTSILPGIVDTPILDNRPEPPPKEVRDAALKPEDIARACLFLAMLPPRAYVPELIMVPTAIQALGKTSTATPPVSQGDE